MMNKYILPFLLVFNSVSADYKRLTDYQSILYNLIDEYVTTNSTSSADSVVGFIYSPATVTVFKDSSAAGYTRKDLIFGTYQSSFGVASPKRVIIIGLHDTLVQENRSYDGAFYGSYVALGTSGVIFFGLMRYFWTYFRWVRPALIHYHANHHLFAKIGSSTAPRIPLDTDTTPLVPEPSF